MGSSSGGARVEDDEMEVAVAREVREGGKAGTAGMPSIVGV